MYLDEILLCSTFGSTGKMTQMRAETQPLLLSDGGPIDTHRCHPIDTRRCHPIDTHRCQQTFCPRFTPLFMSVLFMIVLTLMRKAAKSIDSCTSDICKLMKFTFLFLFEWIQTLGTASVCILTMLLVMVWDISLYHNCIFQGEISIKYSGISLLLVKDVTVVFVAKKNKRRDKFIEKRLANSLSSLTLF